MPLARICIFKLTQATRNSRIVTNYLQFSFPRIQKQHLTADEGKKNQKCKERLKQLTVVK